jgi:hypothetical protein
MKDVGENARSAAVLLGCGSFEVDPQSAQEGPI